MKRKKQKGFVYLLKGVDESGNLLAKYGCTRNREIKHRIYYANKRAKKLYSIKYSFWLYYFFESDDIFNDENKIKHHLWDVYCTGDGEFFDACLLDHVMSKL